MRVQLVAVVSLIGVLVSLWLVRDAVRDRYFYRSFHEPDSLYHRITLDRLIAEILRLLVQLSFFIISVIFVLADRASSIRTAAVWLLVLVPIIIAIWSVYAWWGRRQLLEEVSRVSGRPN